MPLASSIVEAAAAMRAGRLTPLELVDDCLARIDRFDEQIMAWVVVDRDGAQAAARRLAEEAARGAWRGPLHGIPIGVKDIIDVAGMPTRAGSPLTTANPAAADATVVARLRRAGAIILGKTVTTEFACFDPAATRNPWNLAHTPGGSSSGSAAAVAMSMCFGALGTQTGGSITRPAGYCGIAGFKPTFVPVSRDGVVPVSKHLDHVGALARCAADLLALWQALAGGDADYADGGVDLPEGYALGYQKALPPRLGFNTSFFLDQADAPVRATTEREIQRLEAAGASIVPIELPDSFRDVHRHHRTIMAVEAAAYHRDQFTKHRASHGPNLAALLDEGLATPPADYQAALDHQRQFQADIERTLVGVNALVTPATNTTAPASLATTGDPLFNSPWSYAGLPTVSIPCGLAPNGLPSGLQFVGHPFRETPLLMVALWCESRLGFSAEPPLTTVP